MAPESLQSLSVAAVFVGLFFATLGGFGAFHFGREAQRVEEGDRLHVIQTLSDSIALLELDRSGLRDRLAAVEKELGAALAQRAPLAAPAIPVPPLSAAVALPPVADAPANVEKVEPLDILSGAKGSVVKSSSLGAQQRAVLVKRLSAHPHHRVAIHAVEGDPQALELASALESAFREARWKVRGVDVVAHPSPSPGLSLSTGVFPPREEFVTAYSALERAGFLVTSDLDPKQSGQSMVLFVGPKH